MEAAAAGIELVVCITEGVPVLDMTVVYPFIKERGVRLLGPNCPGTHLAWPIEGWHHPRTYLYTRTDWTREAVPVRSRMKSFYQMTRAGLGQTTCVGIGGDPINGTNFIDCLDAFENDPETKAVVMIGEIGGTDEQDAAKFVKERMTKTCGWLHRWPDRAAGAPHGSRGGQSSRAQLEPQPKKCRRSRKMASASPSGQSTWLASSKRECAKWLENYTLTIIKPDAFMSGKGGQIIAHLEQQGFKVRGGSGRFTSRAPRRASFYAVHRERPFFSAPSRRS